MKIKTLIIVLLTYVLSVTASDGKWELYPSYNNITEIEPTGSNVFALASGSIFSYNIKDGSLTTYTKANCLSDIDISHIAWEKTSKRLVITYSDGNIDLLETNGNVINIPDLYSFSTTETKTINNIYINGIYAYLSLSFGIIKINVKEGYIQDTYQLGFYVDHCYIANNKLYAESSTQGKYSAELSSNLLDKRNWTREGEFTPLNVNSTLVYDNTNKCWWTTKDGKLTYYSVDENNEKVYKTEGILPTSPSSNRFYKLYIHNNKLYAVAGAWSQEKDCNYMGEVHVKDGDNWWEFEQPSDASLGHRYRDNLTLDFDPLKEGHVMVGGKSGLYEFQDGKFIQCYNKHNSNITSPMSDSYTIISGIKYDKTGRLWLLNSLTDNPILSYTQSSNNWETFVHQEIESDDRYNLNSILLDQTGGNVWFVNNHYEKNILYKYDYINDKISKYGPGFINEDGNNIKPIYLHCCCEDKKGNIWLGTTSGPLYYASSDIQNDNKIFTQHKVPRNDGTNYADYLLANVNVRSIAIDGANQKWMGTDNGVFLISDDCNTQLQHFTTENSPLISNVIYSIAIDSNSGRVYFATDKGLCSYMSDTIEPATEMDKDNVYAYPNPVRPDYTGYINIVGLSYNADVKIVTSNGSLVNQGRSSGGKYSWNGYDLEGKKVASGIYMVQTATSDGEKGTVCKIAIIR